MKPIHYYIIIIVFSLSVIGVSLYYLLGGFEEIRVYKLPGESKIVVGKHFIGKQTHRDIRKYFNEAQQLVLDSAIMGTLVRIINDNDSLEGDQVDFFIGVMIDGEMAEVPLGFTVNEYYPTNRFAIFMGMNKWVRPSSARIDVMLSGEAEKSGFDSSQGIIAELYYIDDSMSVELWLN